VADAGATEGSTDGLDEVCATRAEYEAALALVDQKAAAWKTAIRRSAAAGTARTEIMKAAKVNRARIYQILDEDKTDTTTEGLTRSD
jgi:hypothetical protein